MVFLLRKKYVTEKQNKCHYELHNNNKSLI